MKLELNQEVLNLCEIEAIDKMEAFCYLFMLQQFGDAGVSFLVEKELITEDNLPIFHVNFTQQDHLNRKLIPKYSVFGESKSTEFSKFTTLLALEGVSVRGHKDNQQNYTVCRLNMDARNAFTELRSDIPQAPLKVLAELTAAYYREGDKRMVLANYLKEGLKMDYLQHTKSSRPHGRSKLI